VYSRGPSQQGPTTPTKPPGRPIACDPVSPSVLGEKFCKNTACENHGKSVAFPRCPFCGIAPEIHPAKFCCLQACENYGKPVEFPRCPFCGTPTEAKKPPRFCLSTACENHGKIVEFPRCPFCGEPAGEQSAQPKLRICVTSGCSNSGNGVDEKYRVCPYCGTAPHYK